MDQPQASFDVSKVYLLQKQLEDMLADTQHDEKEVTDPAIKSQLKASRELIQALVDKIQSQLGKEMPNAVRDMPPGFKLRK